MCKFTIFTTCRPFIGEYKIIQENAIYSWSKLIPKPEIFIMGYIEEGVKEIANKYDNIRILDVEYNKKINQPSMKSIFNIAQKESKNDIVCYTNSDIIHFQCLVDIIKKLKKSDLNEYLAVGTRYDVDIDFKLNEKNLNFEKLVTYNGTLHGSGIDYFIFPRTLDWSHMPNFIVSKTTWDIWICLDILKRNIPLIDTTNVINVIHQNHSKSNKKTEESIKYIDYNVFLAGKIFHRGMYKGIEKEATHCFDKNKNIKKRTIDDMYNKINETHSSIFELNKYGKKVYSQSTEDGAIERIFQCIGTTNKYFVDIGAYDGLKDSNTANLRINNNWNGLLLDSDPQSDIVKKEFITSENINNILKKYNVQYSFDFLSIDINGNDFWIWKALNKFSPRVVVIEFNPNFSPDESKTIPYNPNFKWDKTEYYGASLKALRILGESKQYSLVYTTDVTNAFFVLSHLLHPDERNIPMENFFTHKFPSYKRKFVDVFKGNDTSYNHS